MNVCVHDIYTCSNIHVSVYVKYMCLFINVIANIDE